MMEWMRKHDVLPRLASLVSAVILWFFVVDSMDKTMTLPVTNFPIEFTGTGLLLNNDLVIIEGADSTVSFEIDGKTSKLKTIDMNYVRATADLSNITVPGTYDVKYELSTIHSGVTLRKMNPSVRIVVDRMVSKPVPVDLTLGGKLEEGYILDRYTLNPDMITVTGPQSVLDKVVSAKAAFDISGLQESTETTLGYALINAEGDEVKSNYLSTATSSIGLSLTVRQTGEIPLVLNVKNYGFITEDEVDIKLSPETVKVNGNPEDIAALNQIDVGTLDLESLFERENFEVELPLILPNGVTTDDNVSKVMVTVGLKDIEKKTIEISAEQLPESTEFTYVSDLLVDVWTTKAHAESLNAGSIDLEVNYEPEALHPGFNELPVRITTQDDKINIIGSYTVVVEVAENDVPVEPSDPN